MNNNKIVLILDYLLSVLIVGNRCSTELPEMGFEMVKLYKTDKTQTKYWETWENDGVFTIHWGEIGSKGKSIEIKNRIFKSARKFTEKEMNIKKNNGYSEIPDENLKILLIEYSIEGMGSENDLNKRHNLEDKMDETLGWTGLGHCDGGSIGSGTMEVCCFVVDFEKAKEIIEKELINTEFSNYARIYEEKRE